MNAKVRTKQGTLEVEVVKENKKTIWVKMPDGNVVKKHRIKQVVE